MSGSISIIFIIVCVLSGVMGHLFTKAWYKLKIDEVTTKNQQLIERVKKAEGIILHEVLQFSPDDINTLKEKMKKQNLEKK